MYNSVEGQSVTPRGSEVAHVYIVVASSLHLTPQQEGILCGFSLLVVSLFDCDILDLVEHRQTIKIIILQKN